MWGPWVGHWFHLTKDDMLDVSLTEFVGMVDFVKQSQE